MQPPGQDFLASATLTKKSNGGMGGGKLFDSTADFEHGRVAAQHTLQTKHRPSLQSCILLLQVIQTEGTFNGEYQQLRLERLGEEVVSPHTYRPQGILPVMLAR